MAKTFNLTDAETKNILGREQAIDYMQDLISRDINMYMYMDIMPRLGLKDEKVELSKDRKSLSIIEEKSEIITKATNGKL